MATAGARHVLRYDDGGWGEAIGGHIALDLVNTVSWRLDPDRTVDRLPDGAAFVRWAELVDLVTARQAAAFGHEVTDEIVAGVRRLREQVYRVVQPMALGLEPTPADVQALRRTSLDAQRRAEVVSLMPLELSIELRSASDLPGLLALAAWRLLEREDARRLRQCSAGDCGWLFLDRTKNGSRVWCSSADCGNRTRARRHYARRTAERS